MQSGYCYKKNAGEQEVLLGDEGFWHKEDDLFSLPKLIAALIQAFHWTYQEIVNAPLAPLLLILEHMRSEGEIDYSQATTPLELSFSGVLAAGPPQGIDNLEDL